MSTFYQTSELKSENMPDIYGLINLDVVVNVVEDAILGSWDASGRSKQVTRGCGGRVFGV